jgi:hypothetical protein
MTMTPEELEAWRVAYVASVEDGSLQAEIDAHLDPRWLAEYGDASWRAALACSGYGSPPSPDLVEGPE